MRTRGCIQACVQEHFLMDPDIVRWSKANPKEVGVAHTCVIPLRIFVLQKRKIAYSFVGYCNIEASKLVFLRAQSHGGRPSIFP
jgi:hypothetical protein